MSDLLQEFFQEADRNLSQVAREFARWSEAPQDPVALNSVFRIVHNVKAACHVMGFNRVESLAHAAEDLLYNLREGQIAASKQAVEAVHSALVQIDALLQEVRAHKMEPSGNDRDLIGHIIQLATPAGDPPAALPADELTFGSLGIEDLLDELRDRAEEVELDDEPRPTELPLIEEITEAGLFPEEGAPEETLPDLDKGVEDPQEAAPSAASAAAYSAEPETGAPGLGSTSNTTAGLQAIEAAILDLGSAAFPELERAPSDPAEAAPSPAAAADQDRETEAQEILEVPEVLEAEDVPDAVAVATDNEAEAAEEIQPEAPRAGPESPTTVPDASLDLTAAAEPDRVSEQMAVEETAVPDAEAPAVESGQSERPDRDEASGENQEPGQEQSASALEDEAIGAAESLPGTLPIASLLPNPDQPRRHVDEAALQDLARSVATHGVIQPILVQALAGQSEQYRIIAGERRWRAAALVGLQAVPVSIVEASEVLSLELSLIENLQREDLTALEEAQGYQRLIDEFSLTQEELAQRIGKSRSHVANTLRLLQLPPAVLEMLQRGALTAGHARALLALEAPEPAAQEVVEKGLSVRETEALAQRPAARLIAAKPAQMSASLKEELSKLERDLSDLLSFRVQVKLRGDKGEVKLRFDSLQSLESLVTRLRGLSSHSDAA